MLGAQSSKYNTKHNPSHTRGSYTHLTRGTHIYVKGCVLCYVQIIVHLASLSIDIYMMNTWDMCLNQNQWTAYESCARAR